MRYGHFEFYCFYADGENLPTVLRMGVLSQKALPRAALTGFVSHSLKEEFQYWFQTLRLKTPARLFSLQVHIYNPLKYKITTLEPVLPKIESILTPNSTTPSGRSVPKTCERFIRGLYPSQKQNNQTLPYSSNHTQAYTPKHILLITPLTAQITPTKTKLLKRLSAQVFKTHKPDCTNYLKTVSSPILEFKQPNIFAIYQLTKPITQQIQYFPQQLFVWNLPTWQTTHQNLTRLKIILNKLTYALIELPPCNCGKKFSKLKCACNRKSLQNYFYQLLSTIDENTTVYLPTQPAAKSVQAKELHKFYL